MEKPKFLVIQTAFIGDVILATGVLEKLHAHFPGAQIDFMVRKGNESLLKNHPFLHKTWVWNKSDGKYKNLLKLTKAIRKEKYDYTINIQRFANSGFVTAFSKAKTKIGFDKNPWSRWFNIAVEHQINNGMHEVERNQKLIESITDSVAENPVLYPSATDFEKVSEYKQEPFICLAPASVWFTKQMPKEKWIEQIQTTPFQGNIYIIGAPSDADLADEIIARGNRGKVFNLCGKLNLLQSAALMKDAAMNYVNDSAPMHLASSVDAKTTAIFCSTIPEFGFGPLAGESHVVEIKEKLACRPCGLHGKKACPEGHFDCGNKLEMEQLHAVLE